MTPQVSSAPASCFPQQPIGCLQEVHQPARQATVLPLAYQQEAGSAFQTSRLPARGWSRGMKPSRLGNCLTHLPGELQYATLSSTMEKRQEANETNKDENLPRPDLPAGRSTISSPWAAHRLLHDQRKIYRFSFPSWLPLTQFCGRFSPRVNYLPFLISCRIANSKWGSARNDKGGKLLFFLLVAHPRSLPLNFKLSPCCRSSWRQGGGLLCQNNSPPARGGDLLLSSTTSNSSCATVGVEVPPPRKHACSPHYSQESCFTKSNDTHTQAAPSPPTPTKPTLHVYAENNTWETGHKQNPAKEFSSANVHGGGGDPRADAESPKTPVHIAEKNRPWKEPWPGSGMQRKDSCHWRTVLQSSADNSSKGEIPDVSSMENCHAGAGAEGQGRLGYFPST